MTPAEQFARKRAEAENLIRQHAPQRLQDSLIELLRPAIALSATRAEDEQIPFGASKFGGAPDVPHDFEWPTWNDKPLGFLAQINLEEVAPFDVENKLPKSGLLSFFFEYGGWRTKEIGTAIYGEPIARYAGQKPKVNKQLQISTFSISTSPIWTLPDTDAPEFPAMGDEAMWEGWNDIYYELFFDEDLVRHQLLGFPLCVQASVEIEAEVNAHGPRHKKNYDRFDQNVREWTLLFQMDSQPRDWLWGDVGKIYFMVRQTDLARGDFGNVQAIFQNH